MTMTALIDLTTELAKLTMLRDRTPGLPRAAREESAARLTPYRDGGIFISKFAGKSDWERHPRGEEIVHIVDGSALLEIVTADTAPQSYTVSARMMAIVPLGAWHRFSSEDGVTLMTATPQPSEHIRADVDDPRAHEQAITD